MSLDIARERVVLVPGNHDVHWPSAAIDKRRRFDNYLGFLLNFYGEDLFRKIYPLIKWNFQVVAYARASVYPDLVYETGT